MTEIFYYLTFFSVLLVTFLLLSRKLFDAPFLYIVLHLIYLGPPVILIAMGLEVATDFFYLINYHEVLVLQTGIMALHFVSLTIGYLIFNKTSFGRSLFPYYDNKKRSNNMTLLGLSVLTFINLIIIMQPFLQAGGILQTIALIRHEFFFSGVNFLRIFIVSSTYLCAAEILYIGKRKKEGDHVIPHSKFYVIILLVLNISFATLLGGKVFIIFPLLSMVLAYIVSVKSPQKIITYALIIGVIFAVFIPTLQIIRTQFVKEAAHKPLWEHIYVGLRFRLFDNNMVYLGTHGKYHETKIGEDFYSGLVGPIPRSIWKNKPEIINAGGRFKEALVPGGEGAWPIYGFNQWYTNFGWLGVLFGGVFTGILLQSLQSQYRDFNKNPYSAVFMSMVVFHILTPGGWDNIFPTEYVFYVLPLFVFRWMISRKLYWTNEMNIKPRQ